MMNPAQLESAVHADHLKKLSALESSVRLVVRLYTARPYGSVADVDQAAFHLRDEIAPYVENGWTLFGNRTIDSAVVRAGAGLARTVLSSQSGPAATKAVQMLVAFAVGKVAGHTSPPVLAAAQVAMIAVIAARRSELVSSFYLPGFRGPFQHADVLQFLPLENLQRVVDGRVAGSAQALRALEMVARTGVFLMAAEAETVKRQEGEEGGPPGFAPGLFANWAVELSERFSPLWRVNNKTEGGAGSGGYDNDDGASMNSIAKEKMLLHQRDTGSSDGSEYEKRRESVERRSRASWLLRLLCCDKR